MNQYPLPRFHFSVEWGESRIDFTEVSGLDAQHQAIEYRHGAQPQHSFLKVPGLLKYSNVTLKRGVIKGDNDFYNWFKSVSTNDFRKDITIKLLDERHEPTMVWKLKSAWPVKIHSTDLKANANEIAIETLELAHEGLTIQNE